MKFKLLIISLVFLGTRATGQDVTRQFEEVKHVTIRNMGTITKNNEVKGYYSFYEFDKVNRKTLLYRLNLLDENLNELGTKDITGPRDWELISSGYDGNNFCFKFWDERKKTFELKVYDQDANEVTSNTLKVNYNPKSAEFMRYKEVVGQELAILGNNGFVNYTFNDPNNAFIISYVDGASKNSWQQTYQPEGKSKVMAPTFLNGNKEMILTAVSRIDKGFDNLKTKQSILGTRTDDGTRLFDLSTEFGDNHVVPINAIFEGEKIIIIGLNYKTSKTYTTAPDGLAFLEIDKTGKILKSNFKNIEESLGKFLPMEDHKLKDGYYLYIHDIVKTNHNTSLIIAEKFKKGSAAGAAASIAVSMFANIGAHLKLENMVVIEYDADGNVVQAQEIPKAEGSADDLPAYAALFPPYLLASVANILGHMDYMYKTNNTDNSQITFSFIDYGRIDDDSKKTNNFGQIKYKNGKISVDKIAIKKEKATFTHLYRAKPGHVLKIDYFKKDKKLTMNLITLNN
ncbi:MAG: hypothetical protein JWP44_3089 [Mucilaginibacter sp.]|nr:hypothetical protein [Mucilaginibacter sp.]